MKQGLFNDGYLGRRILAGVINQIRARQIGDRERGAWRCVGQGGA